MAIKLSDVQVGSACTVIEIKGGLRVRRYLAKLGVLPGAELTLEAKMGFRGHCYWRWKERKIGVGPAMTKF